MDRRWTSHLKDPEEAKRFQSYIKNSKGVLDRQLEILNQMEETIVSEELGKDTYESPSWAFKQADNLASRRMIRDFKKLITLDQGKING